MKTAVKGKRPSKPAAKPAAKPLRKSSPPKPTAKARRGVTSADDRRDMEEAAEQGAKRAAAAHKSKKGEAVAPAQLIPLKQLRAWKRNPRKQLGDLTELAASLKSTGQIHDIVVRPHPTEPNCFEIAAGHRRLAAAELAGLPGLRAVVRSLTDAQMLEIALTENGLREGLTPLEEARALEELHHYHHVDVPELAARLGRPKGYVYQRLSLLNLHKEAWTALETGRLSLSVALKLARLPLASQEGVLSQIVVGDGQTPRSLDSCAWAFQRLHLTLVNAPFSLADATLPGGSCKRCPKRSGNQANLFTEAEGHDLCLDPSCHKTKVETHKARTLEQLQAQGHEVLDKKAGEKLFDWGGKVGWDQPYIDLDTLAPTDSRDESSDTENNGPVADRVVSARTWRDLLGDKVKVLIAEDRHGTLHHLVRVEEARDALPPTAPAEVHAAVALETSSSERENAWELQRAERERARNERKKKVAAIAAAHPTFDLSLFHVLAAESLIERFDEDSLKAAGLLVEDGEGDDATFNPQATRERLLTAPLNAVWRVWIAQELEAFDHVLDLDALLPTAAEASPAIETPGLGGGVSPSQKKTLPLIPGVQPAPAPEEV